ncbi:MAG: hypothetical protein ACR2MB_11415 [Acidimicrobiales bacterium]
MVSSTPTASLDRPRIADATRHAELSALTDDALTDDALTDDELTAAALAADPDAVADGDAPSLWEMDASPRGGLLPSWYLPVSPAGSRRLRGWRRRLAYLVIATFLAIDAVGLCSTYGPLIFGR